MADQYERERMPGVGAMLFRHKVSSPRWLIALMTALPLGLGGAAAVPLLVAGQILPAAAVAAGSAVLAAFFTILNVTFSTARIAVSEGEVHIQLGLAGPKLPIGGIARVEVAPSGINKVGMGVGSDLQGTTYYRFWGDNRRAVHLETITGKRLVIVMKEPDAMARAIEEAMARHRGAAPKVRVAAEGDQDELPETERAQDADRAG